MATRDPREARKAGFGNTTPPDDQPPMTVNDQSAGQRARDDGTSGSNGTGDQPKNASPASQLADNDSTSNSGSPNGSGQSASNKASGAGDSGAGAEASKNSSGATASGDNGAAAAGGNDTTTADTGTNTSSGNTASNESGDNPAHGPALDLPIIGDFGMTDGLGNRLIHDAAADTQSVGGTVLADLRSSGSDLVTDLINGTDQFVGNATGHLGLGGVVGDNLVADIANDLTNALPGDIGHGLIPDAVADTQSLATTVLADATGSSRSLLTDVVNGSSQLADNAVNNLNIGDTGHLLGGVTGALGHNINVGDVIGDGPLVNGSVLNGDGAIVNPLSEATGGLTDSLLGSSTGDGPLAAIGIAESRSPELGNVLDDTGDGLLSGLGIGQIAKVSGVQDANGNPAISASAGNNPGDSGPFVNAQGFSDNGSPSNNLIDFDAGPKGGTSGSSSDIVANAFGGSADGSNPLIDGNLIGTNGQTAAKAEVLTSPDQFHFPVLDGVGTDSLSSALGADAGRAVASLVPDGAPIVGPILDVNLAGDAHAEDTHSPLHGTLAGQLLGSA